MPKVLTTQEEEEAKAKARVELFRTQAVGIVDRAANGEVFLALKSAGMEGQQAPQDGAPAPAEKSPEPPATPPPAAALKMPAAARQAMTEALGAVLDTCAKMAEALETAVVDDAASVPPELIQMAADAADGLDAMCEPYEEAMMAVQPAPLPPPDGQPAQKADAPAAPPPKPPRPRMAMKRIMAMDGVAKSLMEGAQQLGELVSWSKGAAGMPAPATKAGMCDAKKADLDPYTAMSATADAVRERMRSLREMLENDPAAVANELRQIIPMVDNLAMLVTQARSGAMAPPAGAPAGAPPPAPAPAMTEEAQMAVQKAVAAGVASAVGSLKSEFSGLLLAAKGAAASAQAALTKVEKSVPAPNAQPAGENPTTPAGAPPPADPWRTVSKDIQQARSGAAGK